ncbi:MAG: hypothetical protein NC212_03325 [Staphylococcus sp.]|nr:hypothetical protein [Staphylococcus sp.]
MDEALSHYLRALSYPDIPVSISDVERLMKEYPFFTLPAVTLLRREGEALPAETRRKLLEHAALNSPDPTALSILTDPKCETWANFYAAEKEKTVTTEKVIDTFLATYGHSSPKDDELLEKLIFNPAADYSALLAREEEESLPDAPDEADDSQDALINAFILKGKSEKISLPSDAGQTDVETQPELTPKTSPEEIPAASQEPKSQPATSHQTHADDTSLSESLAKIYIRRRRYDKAFEIIHNLSLKNPKKSVYFADQLRFLRKLMLNSSFNE